MATRTTRSTKDDSRAATAQVKAYFAAQPPAARRRLAEMRDAIRAAAPGAVEGFSYRIPGFRLDERPLVWYAGFRNHTSLYPVSDSIKRAFAKQLEGYETAKGTVRFPLDQPLPVSLLKKLVKARMAEARAPRPKPTRAASRASR